ncbi:MAG: hypothetical protein V3U02_11330 [Calditrichia bacterium]
MTDKREFEDKILNPLNNIAMFVESENFGQTEKEAVLKEIDRIVDFLEGKGLICKRKAKNPLP